MGVEVRVLSRAPPIIANSNPELAIFVFIRTRLVLPSKYEVSTEVSTQICTFYEARPSERRRSGAVGARPISRSMASAAAVSITDWYCR